jgi:hypothetical protein
MKQLEVLLCKLHSGSLIYNYGTRVAIAKPIDLVRVMASWKTEDAVDLTIKNILISSVLSAEKRQVGAGMVCAQQLISLQEAVVPPTRDTLTHRVEDPELDDTLKYYLGPGMVYELMSTIIKNGGLVATLSFGFSASKDFVILAQSSEELHGEIHPFFEQAQIGDQFENAAIIGIGGILNSVAEIDHILQEIAFQGCTAIICAESFAPDVVITFKQNWETGQLKIVPFMFSKKSLVAAPEVFKKLGIAWIAAGSVMALSSTTLDDFTVQEAIRVSNSGISISHLGGSLQHIEVKIPKRLANMTGVIKDRCSLAQKACMSLVRSGKSENSFMPYTKNYEIRTSYAAQVVGIRAAASCKTIMKELGAIVTDA